MAPRYFEPKVVATKIEVGPSAAPMIAMEAASSTSKPRRAAMHRVKKMPNCAAAPNIISLGFDKSGLKSIIAPMPTNKSRGKSSFDTPALKSTSSGPSSSAWVTAPELGRLTSIVPKPMGRSSEGSISFLMAR